jgi:prephenate dehydrogenase
MKDINIGVIGGTGGMGLWFADLLKREGHTVHISSRKTKLSPEELTKICDVVVVAVPISVTAEVIKKVGPLLNQDQLLMDLTSLKREPLDLMLANTAAEVIGCHPLFGPAVLESKDQNVVLCPGRGNMWYKWLKELFDKKGFNVLERSAAEHDEMMSIIQVLNHLNTISLGMALAQTGQARDELNKFSTPIFRTKLDIVKKVFTESPGLYAEIIAGNSETEKIIDIYGQVLREIRFAIKSGGSTELKDKIEEARRKLF